MVARALWAVEQLRDHQLVHIGGMHWFREVAPGAVAAAREAAHGAATEGAGDEAEAGEMEEGAAMEERAGVGPSATAEGARVALELRALAGGRVHAALTVQAATEPPHSAERAPHTQVHEHGAERGAESSSSEPEQPPQAGVALARLHTHSAAESSVRVALALHAAIDLTAE